MAKVKHKPLTKAQKTLSPYGTNKCRLCRMAPKELEHVHYLRLDEKMTLKDLLSVMREDYKMGMSYNELCNHFNKHLSITGKKGIGRKVNKKLTEKLVDSQNSQIAEVLSPIVARNAHIDQQLETAYSSMIRMTQDYVSLLSKLKGFVDSKFSNQTELKKDFEKYDAIKLMNAYTAFLKEHREQMKDINALRAPKVVMVQFLESALKAIVEEMSNVFAMICTGLQEGVSHELRKSGVKNIVNDNLFTPTFQRVAQEYQSKMTEIVREQLYQVKLSLSELEKLQ